MVLTTPMRSLLAAMWLLALGAAATPTFAAKGAVADAAPRSRSCPTEAVARSICILELLLADVRATYRPRGGGGISAIVQKSTLHFQVQISQEQRLDLIDYEVSVAADGLVRITSRKTGTGS